jgi:ATP-dependent DNA helicase RecQ
MKKLDYRTAAGLDDAALETVESAMRDFRSKGITALSPVFEALGGEYPYDLLRVVKAGMDQG